MAKGKHGKQLRQTIGTHLANLDGATGPSPLPSITSRPRRVCLCGSTRFKDAFAQANKSETLAGRIVLSVGMMGHHEGLDMNGPVKAELDQLHLRKIDLADEILVLNVGGYIGDSTRREIAYAKAHCKPIRLGIECPRDIPIYRQELLPLKDATQTAPKT